MKTAILSMRRNLLSTLMQESRVVKATKSSRKRSERASRTMAICTMSKTLHQLAKAGFDELVHFAGGQLEQWQRTGKRIGLVLVTPTLSIKRMLALNLGVFALREIFRTGEEGRLALNVS